ncbi:subtilisin-like protease SBT1.7 [Asparagus officinalis]|uniref:subtilisin-like protease SBT1.7 n=1 Tax=Asparagus officinalis TaxID=4686 RepID=UPI00098DF07E|nr:subtilisin-like protease SBT1.7 [Asparagus officinalis]
MDAAIKDGVDIISMSLGGTIHDYRQDVIAIGAFSAMEKGIFVSCAAGNSGPESETLSNEAPWILTVGASTMDRSIRVTVKLGDGQEVNGESVFQPKNFTSEALPLVRPNGSGSLYQTNCLTPAMNGIVNGKIVMCERPESGPRVEIGSTVKDSGGAGMILINAEQDGYTTLAEAHVLPASHISYNDGQKIFAYFKSSDKPTASLIFKGTILGNTSAPTVASFSSRGPSLASPLVLKPDIIGPGVSVLAGWPSDVETSHDQSNPTFNILSGTSMSTPHLSGIAALVKGMHPEWSPAAIKSAIMTTSNIACNDGKPVMNELHEPATYYKMGAGHVNPEKASDPGLVYDISADDYVGFLCGLGYYDKDVEAVTRRKVKCADVAKVNQSQLNYPSITVYLLSGEKTVTRTVTNVGGGKEKYEVKLDVPKGVEVSVDPEVLEFDEVNEKKSFVVSFKKKEEGEDDFVEGEMKWVSDKHVVRSPIIVTKDIYD